MCFKASWIISTSVGLATSKYEQRFGGFMTPNDVTTLFWFVMLGAGIAIAAVLITAIIFNNRKDQ